MQRQVTNLTRLVDDLLDISRITQGRVELRRQPVQLSDVVAQAVETVAPSCEEEPGAVGHDLSLDVGQRRSCAPRAMRCEPLNNAAKYTDRSARFTSRFVTMAITPP